MSRLPSRLETKSRLRPSGIQAGLVLSEASSVTRYGRPPAADMTQTELGAMLPIALGAYTKAALPSTNASREPSGDQANEWGWSKVASRVGTPTSTART